MKTISRLCTLGLLFAGILQDASAGPYDLWGEGARTRLAELSPQLEDLDAGAAVRLEAGILHHAISVEGQQGHGASAVALLEPFVVATPDDALALAILGSARTLVGRDTRNTLRKVNKVKGGVKELDRAVDMASDDITLRVLRAENSNSLPAIFGRRETFDADIEFLLANLDEVEAAQRGLQATCYLLIGDYHKNKSTYTLAIAAWSRAVEVAFEGSVVRDVAQGRLAVFQP